MSDLGGFSLFELFKAEAETHCGTLNEGLLRLEGNPADLSAIEPLMRAAHSLKGAARIIGVDLAVRLAHAMEDCLVAVQKGQEVLVPARIDQLLQGTDLLSKLGQIAEAELPSFSEKTSPAVDALVEATTVGEAAKPEATDDSSEGNSAEGKPAAAPGAATEPADVKASGPETDLVGSWKATMGDDSVELTVKEDFTFTWKALPWVETVG